MGEIAEMMLNGDLDCETGEWIGPGDGFPRTTNRRPHWDRPQKAVKSFQCQDPHCRKMFTQQESVKQHTRAVHPRLAENLGWIRR